MASEWAQGMPKHMIYCRSMSAKSADNLFPRQKTFQARQLETKNLHKLKL